MERGLLRVSRWMILAFSFFMFCHQSQVALNKLVDPPVVDSTEIRNVVDTEPPLMTICPLNQFNQTRISELGYKNYFHLLTGYDSEKGIISWGAQHNLSFEELINEAQYVYEDFPKFYMRQPKSDVKFQKRFYPKYGYCFDFENYTITENIILAVSIDDHANDNFAAEADVFFTDKNLRTMNTLKTESHWGPSITLKHGWFHKYLIKVQQLSYFDPRKPNSCKEYAGDMFQECIDEGLQDIWTSKIDCNPPWFSPVNQCRGIVNITEQKIQNIFSDEEFLNVLEGYFFGMRYPKVAKKKCNKMPCTLTQPNIIFKYARNAGTKDSAKLDLQFDNLVVKRTRVLVMAFLII